MQPTLSAEEYEQRVRERAYQLWEEAGRPDGLADHFWYVARDAFDAEHAEAAMPHAGAPGSDSPHAPFAEHLA